jgi:hypothetical protein
MASLANNLNVNQVAGEQTATPAYTLYTPGSVALATVFGGPIAGTILMAINYRRLGRTENAALAVLSGIGATAFAILLGVLVPQIPPICTAIAIFSMLWKSAESLQGGMIGQHVNQGGRLGSKLAAFALGLVFMVVIIGVAMMASKNA